MQRIDLDRRGADAAIDLAIAGHVSGSSMSRSASSDSIAERMRSTACAPTD
jgi:hypothetical protein